jgi:hypothetical protein
MRLKVTRLWRAIKRELPIEFGHEQLTSYGGLELVRRYFHLIGLNARIRRALGKHVGGDYGCTPKKDSGGFADFDMISEVLDATSEA